MGLAAASRKVFRIVALGRVFATKALSRRKGCSDIDGAIAMEMRESTICEMSDSTICEISESTIRELESLHFESMSDAPSSMDDETPIMEKMYMVHEDDDITPCLLLEDEHGGHMEPTTSTTPTSYERDYKAPEGTCAEPSLGHAFLRIQATSRLWSHPEVTYRRRTADVLQIHFEATNNMAEYEALLHGLRIAKEIGIKHIICCGDSDLVAQQVAGTWNARNSVMVAYRDKVDEIAKCFLGYEVKYVQRDDNTTADMLSKLGSGRKPIPPGIFLEHLRIPSVKGANPKNPDVIVSPAKEVLAIIPAWTQPFLDYLIARKLP
ncbi:hypothetical protein QYE76_008083 [Lolium multiflorum]|uniref:RNase H type-1 domain-containing protein n=1 Tax=Lolium multiflorum TaxID=4521 RepID=A0AAD8UVK2_LOLMU|nr:hypothetical protein QYE76_008083 [Lolium multiflorum]